jgi:hypothetical protein
MVWLFRQVTDFRRLKQNEMSVLCDLVLLLVAAGQKLETERQR